MRGGRFHVRIVTGFLLAALGLPLATAAGAPAVSVPLPTPRPTIAPEPPRPAPRPAAPAPRPAQPTQPACDVSGLVLGEAQNPSQKGPDGSAASCTIDNPVRLEAVLALDDGRRIAVSGMPTLACAHAAAFGAFLRGIADPMAAGHFGAAIRQVHTGPGFECRYRNRANGGKVSAHGRGIALDVAGFELTDGRVVSVGTGPAAHRRFVDALRKAACGHFTTVLGPGADAAHETHLHLDTEMHGRTANYRICQ